MRYTNQPSGRSTGSLPLDWERSDGSPRMVQLDTREGGELEQEGRQDGPPDVPEEHSRVLGDESHGHHSPDSRSSQVWQETKALIDQARDHYEEECKRIWEESERYTKEEP